MITDFRKWRDANRTVEPEPQPQERPASRLQGNGAWSRFVAVDVETSGVDPARDEIIEIAVIVFERDGIVEEFAQTIRPKHPVSLDIQRLTGITEAELDAGKPWEDVRPEVERLLGSLPIVGHSVQFDVAFLQAAGLRVLNRQLDTYQLASALIPDLPNYSLQTVANALGIPLTDDDRHRALADTAAAYLSFCRLLDRIDSYDTSTLMQVADYAAQASWPEAVLFRNAADRELPGPIFHIDGSLKDSRQPPLEFAFTDSREKPEPLRKTGSDRPIDLHAVEHLLAPDGPLPHVLDRYESRPSQQRMAVAVARSLNDDGQLMVEAGTGTGKSLAYLLPAALHAIERGERVVVSTDTLALQDQLYTKDLPDVRTALLESGVTDELRVAVMKGAANYICLTQWFKHIRQPAADPADASLRAKVMLWLGQTTTGDRAELRLTQEEEAHWRSVAAGDQVCTMKSCAYARRGQCFLPRARSQAANAHIVIANHALLLAGGSPEGHVMGAFNRLILDEAHHLEDEATAAYGFYLDRRTPEEFISGLVKADGAVMGGAFAIASTFLTRLPQKVAIEAAPKALDRLTAAESAAGRAALLVGELFQRLGELLPGQKRQSQSYADSLRVTDAVRHRAEWHDLTLFWQDLDKALRTLLETGDWFLQILDKLSLPDDLEHPETKQRDQITLDLSRNLVGLNTITAQLLSVFGKPSPAEVCWIRRSAMQGTISLNVAPLMVDVLLQERLYANVRTVVMTSATLTIDGSFDYMADRLGMQDADGLQLGTPFDHERSTLLYVADDMPEPNDGRYQFELNQALIELLAATEGRALVLFTSYAALQATHRAIKVPLEQHNVVVLGQRIDGSPRQLVERLRSTPGTVVLGTSTFWEGVDIAGDALSLLVITKLPFPVPSDPIHEARSELLENAFLDYSVPQAVLKFKQGFGRLIRSASDRGVCAILDRRVVSKRYGSSFIQSLPPARVQIGSVYDLPYHSVRWLSTPAGSKDGRPATRGGRR
ncbi:MAG: helicase C-terminal domain-containing protein [Thermomicrobiales bacterium]